MKRDDRPRIHWYLIEAAELAKRTGARMKVAAVFSILKWDKHDRQLNEPEKRRLLTGDRWNPQRKSGTVQDLNTSKTGHITITVLQKNGMRFKTLGKNVAVQTGRK